MQEDVDGHLETDNSRAAPARTPNGEADAQRGLQGRDPARSPARKKPVRKEVKTVA